MAFLFYFINWNCWSLIAELYFQFLSYSLYNLQCVFYNLGNSQGFMLLLKQEVNL